MRPETIAKGKTMLASVLQDGATYEEAGAPYGLGRSTVERTIKGLIYQVAHERGIPEVDEDALSSLPRLRQFREPVLQAVATTRPARPNRSERTSGRTRSPPARAACASAATTRTGTWR
jgi:hypothetical protein